MPLDASIHFQFRQSNNWCNTFADVCMCVLCVLPLQVCTTLVISTTTSSSWIPWKWRQNPFSLGLRQNVILCTLHEIEYSNTWAPNTLRPPLSLSLHPDKVIHIQNTLHARSSSHIVRKLFGKWSCFTIVHRAVAVAAARNNTIHILIYFWILHEQIVHSHGQWMSSSLRLHSPGHSHTRFDDENRTIEQRTQPNINEITQTMERSDSSLNFVIFFHFVVADSISLAFRRRCAVATSFSQTSISFE